MHRQLVSVVIIFVAFLSDFVLAWYGVVTFYQDTEFEGTDFPWGITMTQRCYNLGCFNDKASSVKWEGLPTTGVFNGQARIAFFTGKECTGDSRDWPTDGVINEKEGNYPMNFKLDGINDAISSFMIWENSKKPTNGQDLSCPWGIS
ncbi:hypothetical protein PHYSODRAFT_528904 [Phytophthora sojae]|uniref:Uncharacterized protein n=1 Tax=Phytophthora sojae (strain P6497) TaxID=1094619 RepID=G5A9S4_PHYSP|nr:hypothetical protein PHYSODRAFT_528904 [Phytophthora sojae]EGZ07354.1 hypothetical protein PHYSODRAFT_528904 [Phytophthora sojae]|eukprot:XP_009536920.1 hypothetical protein PHYSODRAFT_528904 [Phytophthora sojae]